MYLRRAGRRHTDAGEFLAHYRDPGDRADEEPGLGSVIFLGLTRYRVVHYDHGGTETGGTLIVEHDH